MSARKSPSAVALFRRAWARRVQEENPDLKVGEVQKQLTEIWKQREDLHAQFEEMQEWLRAAAEEAAVEEMELAVRGRRFVAERRQAAMRQIEVDGDVLAHWRERNTRFRRNLAHWGETMQEQFMAFRSVFSRFDSINRSSAAEKDIEMLDCLSEETWDMFVLYRSVVRLGGFASVTSWEEQVLPTGKLQCDDRTAAFLLRHLYFKYLFGIEQAYQDPMQDRESWIRGPAIPSAYHHAQLPPKKKETMVPIDRAFCFEEQIPFVQQRKSPYDGDYTQTSLAVFHSLLSGVESEVVWALNELLLFSFNQEKSPYLHPHILEALMRLMRSIAMPSLGILMEGADSMLELLKLRDEAETQRCTWPDLARPIMTILANFAFARENHRAIASNASCIPFLTILASSSDAILADLAVRTLVQVAQYIDLGSEANGKLKDWIERAVCTQTRHIEQALLLLMLGATSATNQRFFARELPVNVYQQLVGHLYPSDAYLIPCLEAVLHIMRLGEAVKTRVYSQTKLMTRLVDLIDMDEGLVDTEEVNRVRRTAASVLNLLFQQLDLQLRFVSVEQNLFSASVKHHEVAHFLAPVLSVLQHMASSQT